VTATHVYDWKHGWIPLTHAAALAKARGNHKLAEKYVPSTPAQKAKRTPQHLLDYHANRNAQNKRFEDHVGGGITHMDTHTQEFKDYFGVGDHSTSGKVEDRITYQSHLRELSATKADERARNQSYKAGVALGKSHHNAGLSTAAENAQYDAHSANVLHPDHFDQGYADGLTMAYERAAAKSHRSYAPIRSRRDLAGAISELPNTPNGAAARERITNAARRLKALDLLPSAWKVAAATPLVQAIAASQGVNLATIRGTGVGGRIRLADVLAAR
jgi:pyruvate/2-oxoglutarate dehydrogenase complex dihydrolipoamide acyltransferase (E2) component